ncbi:MAG: carbohydrate porin [Betaproteobacteria bacterium]|nr:MAG: carbohydrate porin [Betaproteobacteria bacterium]
MLRERRICLWYVGVLLPVACWAQTPQSEDWNAKFQATYIWQYKRPFGLNSLSSEREKSYSFSATGYLGLRPWTGGEFYINPQVSQGTSFSDEKGLGAFTSGDLSAAHDGPPPTLSLTRIFLRQTWGFGGAKEDIESDANQLAGKVDRRRFVLTAGYMYVLDLFDDNAFSHDLRTQFMNWSLFTQGAYQYAADAYGRTWGLALEYYYDDWAIRAGRFMQAKLPGGRSLDTRILRHYGDQLEVERRHEIAGQPGVVRLLAFHNRAVMSRFQDALDFAAANGGTPDIDDVRNREQVKYGFGLNVEQNLTPDVSVFARASWSDGRTATYTFAEVDRSVSAGASIRGSAWARREDTLGVGVARNALSQVHREYLAAGGLGVFIGDGRIDYRPEEIFETYYSVNVFKNAWVTFDFQRIRDPAYNADRGPVTVESLRMHIEF